MGINYLEESEKYRPKIIRLLLIGEAPPALKKTYFYVPRPCSEVLPIRQDRSLPATIFNHYFRKRPKTKEDYTAFLSRLQKMGVFLIDICDEPIKVRGRPDGVQRIVEEIPRLREKMSARRISIADRDIVFLLARTDYLKEIRQEFPDSKHVRWIDFRMSPEPLGQNVQSLT